MTGEVPRMTLSKDERLHGRNDIAGLLAKGKFRSDSVLRYCFCPNGLDFDRIMVSVPKKLFKRAVKRNTLKRRIRESFRLQKRTVAEGGGADILFIYTRKDMAESPVIFSSVGRILNEIGHGLK